MITWSEPKHHNGHPYIESIEPRGYTIISVPLPGGSECRQLFASYDGPEKALPPHVSYIKALEVSERKGAVRKSKQACEDHYAGALAPGEDAQSLVA